MKHTPCFVTEVFAQTLENRKIDLQQLDLSTLLCS
jgi:hypothetical protein